MENKKQVFKDESVNYIVYGRRRFDAINGNTYHIVEIYKVDADKKETLLLRSSITYGYEDQYIVTAYELLKEKNYLCDGIEYRDFARWEKTHIVQFNVVDVRERLEL